MYYLSYSSNDTFEGIGGEEMKYSILVFKKIRTTTDLGLKQAIRIKKELEQEYPCSHKWDSEFRIVMREVKQ